MKSFSLAAAAFAGAATARIVGMAAPAQIAPIQQINVTLITQDYIQSVQDLSCAFALTSELDGGGDLGTVHQGTANDSAIEEKSNVLDNLTFTLTMPDETTTKDKKYITGIVNSLYGVSNTAATIEFAVPVSTDGDANQENSDIIGTPGNCFASDTSKAKRDDSCFPTTTTTSIQSCLSLANSLVNDVYQNNSQSGSQDLGELQGHLGDVFRAVDVSSKGEVACGNPSTPPSWPSNLTPADSQARAIDILRNAQDGLNALQGDVNECGTDQAFQVVCTVMKFVDMLEEFPW
ncbi:Hypothetical predicted protein [Lecanosticta acicola]|uniref:Uncharacterized protein n=1 Tax=Lecanosticta acicola TaxID=111012 RepID=A0AAI8Z2U5_9PEZI|nr:Hypothetical predicted protein [Lecanosticta acicola]